jgi:very-short-patch-repair endonuclease
MHRGIYLVGITPPPLATEQAALLAVGPHAVLSHATAAAFRQVEPALRESMARRLVTAEAQRSAVAPRPGHRGTGQLRSILDTDPRLTRSGAERRLLLLIRRARLPEPETNARVGRWEVDMLWREQRVVVEVDGYATHSSRAAFEADHARDAELRALGYVVLRFTVRQIDVEPEATIAAIARELG